MLLRASMKSRRPDGAHARGLRIAVTEPRPVRWEIRLMVGRNGVSFLDRGWFHRHASSPGGGSTASDADQITNLVIADTVRPDGLSSASPAGSARPRTRTPPAARD